jgi:hypothetical protein
MAWFYENPSYLTSVPGAAAGGSVEVKPPEVSVDVERLLNPNFPASTFSRASHVAGGAAWRHFMQSVLQCFREPTGQTKSHDTAANGTSELDEDDTRAGRGPLETNDERHLKFFEQLLNTMLKAPESNRNLPQAYFVTQFVCDRLEPEQWRVRDYLGRLVESFSLHPPTGADSEVAPVAVLVWAAGLNEQSDSSRARVVRGKLHHLGTDVGGDMPNLDLARGFIRLLHPELDFHKLWQNIVDVRTPHEEVKAYRSEASRSLPEQDFPFLSSTPEWETLKRGQCMGIYIMPHYSDVCPFCYTTLPIAKAERLRQDALTDCCGRILLCEES